MKPTASLVGVTLAFAIAFATLTHGLALNAQQRDAAAAAQRTGSAVIAGVVVSDDESHTPIRRARVMLNSVELGVGDTGTTDDSGRFAFTGLPAGRYSLDASKPAWLPASYGALRPGRPGTSIALVEGQSVQVSIVMAHGAAVSGVVHGPDGLPAAGLQVSVLRYEWQNGERVLNLASANAQAITDDSGTYRAYGLPAGPVIVAIIPRPVARQMDAQSGFLQIAESDIQRALQLTSAASVAPAAGPASLSVEGTPRQLAPVFFPGTTDIAAATPLDITTGEERTGIDLNVQLVPAGQIEGEIRLPTGALAPGGMAVLLSGGPLTATGLGLGGLRTSDVDATGRYVFTGVPPGDYVVGATTANDLWGQADVTVLGRDLVVPVLVEPPTTLSGTLVFDGAAPLPNPSDFHVALIADGAAKILALAQDGQVVHGQFQFKIIPGRYRVSVTGPMQGRWVVASSVARGEDTLDAPLAIGHGESVNDWVITLTDHPSELTGALQDSSGRPAPEYSVIAFSSDRAFWTPNSRRVVQTRPATTGQYSIKALPAGEYFVAAVSDVDPGDAFMPAFLETLMTTAVKVTIVNGGRTVRDLRISTKRRHSHGRAARAFQGTLRPDVVEATTGARVLALSALAIR